jgi:hypothetical protein
MLVHNRFTVRRRTGVAGKAGQTVGLDGDRRASAAGPRHGASRSPSRRSSRCPPARRRRSGPRCAPGRVERGRHRQRVVDEGAVEAVVAGVELHVEAQRVLDEAQHRLLSADRRRAAYSRARWSGVSLARSVTSSPSASGRATSGRPTSREHGLPSPPGRRHVPLGGGRRVARRAVRAGHHHQPAKQRGNSGSRSARWPGWSAARA